MAQTIDQKRASHAWKAVGKGQGDAEFKTMVKKMPVLIQTCGLGQAMAFLEAKKKAPALAEALDSWLAAAIPGQGRLLERIVNGDSDFLERATDEAIAYLLWLGRLTEAGAKN